MRVLLTTWAWPTHLYALVPFGWAARLAGHEVVVASQPALLPEIARTGLPGVAVGHDVDAVGMVRGYLLPKAGGGSPAPQPPRAGDRPRALQMVLAHAESMVDDLVAFARDWRADVVVYEPTALAGPVAAAAEGLPAVRHLFGPDLLHRSRAVLPEVLAPVAERHGAGPVDPFGVVTVDPTPDELQVATDYPRIPVRYVPFAGGGSLPVWGKGRGGRPRVCLTWGHTIAKVDPERFLVPWLAGVLGDMDVDLVAAVSSAQRPLLGDAVEDGVDVVVDAALRDVLPGCDLVVSHGGAATTLTALGLGVPLLVMPALPDHAGHSARVVAAGAGEQLPAGSATPAAVRAAVHRLLDGPDARAGAAAVRERMLARPAPGDAVTEVERLVEVGAAAT
ncbi:UDP:flavonoid glycosyltransferase YjiC, YdhE family [Amycolatopsis arida]|uniref:UDP:flavonoid glycosyltransferase YjiC, YdhE family n=1 Tax=Amycolatopsis arida TaxID=587909 RepID=A0A1I5VAM8_9PSEU|nr:nucleotide disphospho-sugar-binding domain-containing protein [Amycolatopsis arida]TDX91209.1 UDP:flavonoid glycosyltransferase YjiC (YdhE family) [Amycolatopsis arida]SFQ04500.1 UDP:flavonoid glycosyltransferase YjiC, YdhE family [Amycolatopsis arida]